MSGSAASTATACRERMTWIPAAGLCALAAFVLTGGHTVRAASAGGGAGTISGFTVSDVHYSLGSPDKISGVSFRLDAVATRVEVRLTAADSGRPCTISGRDVSCAFPTNELPLRDLGALTVTAVS